MGVQQRLAILLLYLAVQTVASLYQPLILIFGLHLPPHIGRQPCLKQLERLADAVTIGEGHHS